MAILNVHHPDILDFIAAKKEEDRLTNFNISVGITEDFMKKVIKNEEYDLTNPRTKKVVGKYNAREVFDLMVEMAWSNGEPGIIFLDRIDRDNPTPKLGKIESSNPCGEQPLLPYESCNLGSINLSNMVENEKINYKKLAKTVETAVHFLDNVIDVNKYPLNEIERMTKGNRKIGLGVMGFADMLIELDTAYNSEKAIALAGKIMSFISKEAREASVKLAKIRGVFPNFKGSIYDVKDGLRVRNATTTTIAPTGTISIVANCSSGIEPIFALSYIRKVLDDEELIEVNPLFEKVAKEEGFYSDDLMRKIAELGTIQGMDGIPKKIQKVFVTALDISPEWHIKMQSEFQKCIDNAVSKTVNFPKTASRKDVEKVYMLAYELECKGVTIYRYGSRKEQVLSLSKKKEEKLIPRARPSITKGRTIRMQTGCGYLYVTINEDEKGLFEVFAQLGKGGGCAASQTEAISRLVSLALRSGVDIQSVIKQLKDIRCPSPTFVKGGKIFSCPDAIAKAIELYLKKEKVSLEERTTLDDYKGSVLAKGNVVGICPDCGSPLIHEEGCMVCIDKTCGYSKCG
jgi:ribonucleoside-diphosphate reductase alpha chain